MSAERPRYGAAARWAELGAWEVRQPRLEMPFPIEEYGGRVARARALMDEEGMEALIVCGDTGHSGDVRWLVNWHPSVGNAFVFLPARGEPVLMLHDEVFSYDLCSTWVKTISPPSRGADSQLKLRDHMVGLLRDHAVGHRVGLVGETGLPMPAYRGVLADNPNLEVGDVTYRFSAMRAVKSPREIATIREAVRQSDAAIGAVLGALHEGVQENDLAAEALRVMISEGADGFISIPLVVAGPRAAWKHAAPTARPIQRGEPVYVDLGASYHGYYADLARTVFLGEPSREQVNALEFALAATAAVQSVARPGVPAGRLAEVGDEVAARFGLTGKAWGTGHGLGCKLREEPLLDRTNDLVLQPGMVVAIEPMCVSDLGTFVIEDDILITETGSECLSHSPRRNW